MEKTIKIVDFVNGYNKCTKDEFKKRYVDEKLKVISYLPFNNKLELCNRIVNSTSFKTDVLTNNKQIHISSTTRYFLYCRAIIETYTNLGNNSDDTNWLEEYDLLASSGVLDVIISSKDSKIPERELIEFKSLLDMTYSDFLTNNYETHAFVSNQFDKFSIIANGLLSPLVDKLQSKLEDIEEKDIEKLLNKIDKII